MLVLIVPTMVLAPMSCSAISSLISACVISDNALLRVAFEAFIVPPNVLPMAMPRLDIHMAGLSSSDGIFVGWHTRLSACSFLCVKLRAKRCTVIDIQAAVFSQQHLFAQLRDSVV
jgi:hypothetical protein